MTDYRVHLAALTSFREQLALTPFPDPAMAAQRDREVADADQEPAAATLGSLVDHLFAHAASDGYELDLLERASNLWSRGLDLYEALAAFRARLEALLADPSNAVALQDLKSSYAQLESLAANVKTLLTDLQALRGEVAAARHLPPHPRQQDLDIQEWGWGDIVLARRTEAFVREARRQAVDQATSAFAFGMLSGYGANAAGSAYLSEVVGGPRRGHRLRNRLARNAVGSWAARSDPSIPSFGALADQLDETFPTGLPADLGAFLRSVVASTYDRDLDRLPPLPDLEEGYRRLVRHLRLLAAFPLPDPPQPPGEPFLSRLFGNPAAPYEPSMPERTGLVEAGVQPGAITPSTLMPQSNSTKDDAPTHSEPPDSTEVKCGAFWEALGESILFLLGGWIYCIIRCADTGHCDLWDDIKQNWGDAFPSGVYIEGGSGAAEGLTAAGAANVAQSPQITQFIGDLHNLQCLMWDGFQKAYEFLALFGLVYPDALLERRRYRQHLSVPVMEFNTWPLLPETGTRFDEYPATGVEQDATDFGYLHGTTPAAVLSPVPQAGVTSAADISMAVWEQIAMGVQDSSNLDLDADRGWRFPCWATDGSIDDQPVGVRVLAYDEV